MTNHTATIVLLAKALLPGIRAQYASYMEECETYYREGLTPQYCEHGTTRWTDYDNICWGCEEGITAYAGGAYHIALVQARARVQQTEERLARYRALTDGRTGDSIPGDLKKSLVDWAIERLKV